MIHIIDDYYVDGGAKDYTLLKDMHRKDKKSGEDVYKAVGYYSSVANAVESVRKIKCRELTHKQNMMLCEAVKGFKQITEELEKATEGLI